MLLISGLFISNFFLNSSGIYYPEIGTFLSVLFIQHQYIVLLEPSNPESSSPYTMQKIVSVSPNKKYTKIKQHVIFFDLGFDDKEIRYHKK